MRVHVIDVGQKHLYTAKNLYGTTRNQIEDWNCIVDTKIP